MWYAVETAFIDRKHFASRPCFDMNVDPKYRGVQPGTCLCEHYEEPHNTVETFMEKRIEIYTDWFQTKEQAMKFCSGLLTYVMHYNTKYRRDINTTLSTFVRWEAVPVTGDMEPFKGVYQYHKERT